MTSRSGHLGEDRGWDRLRWPRLWTAPAVVVVALVLGNLVAYGLVVWTEYPSTVAATSVFQISLALGSFWFIARANRLTWAGLAARAVEFKSSDLFYVLGYVVLVIPLALAVSLVLAGLGVVDEGHAAELMNPGVIVLSYTIAPVAEELWGRGLLYGSLSRFGPGLAIIITALVSSAIHLSIPQMVATLPGMLALGVIRWRTGRLAPCLVAHAANNAFVAALVSFALRFGVG